jgi:hypothetical protein
MYSFALQASPNRLNEGKNMRSIALATLAIAQLGLKFQIYDQWVVSGAHVPVGGPVGH